jgi:hypothetical protein
VYRRDSDVDCCRSPHQPEAEASSRCQTTAHPDGRLVLLENRWKKRDGADDRRQEEPACDVLARLRPMIANVNNGPRNRLWKSELQKFADETKLDVHVSHLPPGTSKWNKMLGEQH